MSIVLDKILEIELNEMAEMAIHIWRDYYPAIIGEAQTEYMLSSIYSAEALKNNTETNYWIISESIRAGFLSVATGEDGELFLKKIYILPEKQLHGIGSSIFSILEDLYPWYTSMSLTVNRKNIQAINFYFKNGFTIDHVEDFDIGEGYFMEDFVMKRKFAQNVE